VRTSLRRRKIAAEPLGTGVRIHPRENLNARPVPWFQGKFLEGLKFAHERVRADYGPETNAQAGGSLVLDDELLGFIRASFRSTWALELLLLMRREQTRVYATDDLVLALRATPALIGGCLQQLESAGLVDHDESGNWRYAPIAAALDRLTDRLASAYVERPIAVITAIADQRKDPLRTLSDAFRFTKKDD
jgi:hypothetical protein